MVKQNATAISGAQNIISIKQKQKWGLGKKIAIVAGVFIVFIFSIILIVNMATSAPLKISDEMVANIQSKNSTAAYELLSTETKETISKNDFKAIVNQIAPILNSKPEMQSKNIKAATGKTTTAKVIYKIAGSDGLTYNFTVNLVEKDSKWTVQSFESAKE